MTDQRYFTVGTIAEQLKQPLHRIEYVLRTRKWIKPHTKLGQAWVYDRTAVRSIMAVILQLDESNQRRRAAKEESNE